MEERTDRKYTVLDITESGRKFATLSSINGTISILSNQKVYEYSIASQKQNDRECYVELQSEVSEVSGEIVYGYELHGVKYMGKGLLSGSALTVKEGTYRLEKREHERLLVWPHYKVYAYFDLGLSRKSNVASINRDTRNTLKSFNKYLENRSMQVSGREELTGLRVLDISKTGISFLANQNEMTLFEVGETLNALIDFSGAQFSDLKATVVYTVDYINPKARTVRMYKVGLNFETPNPDLTVKLEEYLGRASEMVDLKSECEKFSEFINRG